MTRASLAAFIQASAAWDAARKSHVRDLGKVSAAVIVVITSLLAGPTRSRLLIYGPRRASILLALYPPDSVRLTSERQNFDANHPKFFVFPGN